jgi:hypothetical protein
MSASNERVFSGAKKTITPERNRLGGTMIETTECIKSWVKAVAGRTYSVLHGVFKNSQQVEEAARLLEDTEASSSEAIELGS